MLEMIKNTLEIRKVNTKRIIDYLRHVKYDTKKNIAEDLSLSFATVSTICNELAKYKVLKKQNILKSEGGRIPLALSIDENSWISVGIDLTVTNQINLGVMNLKNNIIHTEQISYNNGKKIDYILSTITNKVREIDEKYTDSSISGIGISIPGIYDNKSGMILNSTIPLFEEVKLKEELEATLPFDFYIENESNLLVKAVVQIDQKIKEEKMDVIYRFIGEGLGVGIVSGGEILTGSRGMGAEIGHMPIGSEETICSCGNTGCAENELSFKGFLRKYYGEDRKFNLNDWNTFVKDVKSGKDHAHKVIKEEACLLGKVISILINLFDPQILFVGGIVDEIYDYIYPYTLEETKKRVLLSNYRDINIKKTIDKDKLIFIGCNQLVFENWII